MNKKEIKSYIEQAIRKLPTNEEVAGSKYYLRKAIRLLDEPEKAEQITNVAPIKKPLPLNEQYNFQPVSNIPNAKQIVAGLDLLIEQEKKKLEKIQNKKKKSNENDENDENMDPIFG
jgi:hypothetical protein